MDDNEQIIKPINYISRKAGKIAAVRDNCIEVYKNFRLLNTITETEQIRGIDFFDENKIISVTSKVISLYNVSTGKKSTRFLTDYGDINCVKCARKTGYIFTGTSAGFAVVYHIKEGAIEKLAQMPQVNSPITCIDVRIKKKDDITIFGGCKSELVVWDMAIRTVSEKINVSDGKYPILCLLSLSNNDIVVSDESGTLSIYETVAFTCKQHLKASKQDIRCLAKNKDESEIVCAGKDSILRKLRKLLDGKWIFTDKIYAHTHPVNAVAFISVKGIVSGGIDTSLVHSARTVKGYEMSQIGKAIKRKDAKLLLPPPSKRNRYSTT